MFFKQSAVSTLIHRLILGKFHKYKIYFSKEIIGLLETLSTKKYDQQEFDSGSGSIRHGSVHRGGILCIVGVHLDGRVEVTPACYTALSDGP